MFVVQPRPPRPPSSPIYPTPDIAKICQGDVVCSRVFEWTANQWLASSSYWVIVKPLRILAIVAGRDADPLAAAPGDPAADPQHQPGLDAGPAQAAQGEDRPAVEEGQFIPERRRQRAEAIGSVLRSFVTAVVFTMAALLVFGELGFNLGPLLASAGIVGVALGFGAQSLVKDLIAGLFMLLEDQYGVGDTVDLGEAVGIVESVGLRITTVRDSRGVLWYIRNGEIVRVGNKSQGWALVVMDIPIGFVSSEEAVAVLRVAAERVAESPEHQTEFLEPPDVVGVEQLTVDGAVIRTIAKTTADGQATVQRELRRALTEALETAGLSERIAASRLVPRSAVPPPYAPPTGPEAPPEWS